MNYAKAISRIKTIGIVCLLLILSAWDMRAQSNDSIVVAPDSSNFVTASLLIISPTNEVYSVFGHTAFRMECPVHKLDYVFTFESDPGVSGFLTFFAGKAKGYFVAIPTQEFIGNIKSEGRGIKQYELDLTLHEEQELWRNLDNDMVAGPHRQFNLQNHCASTALELIRQSCIDEYLDWGPKVGELNMNNGDLLRYYVKNSEWAEFLFISFVGTHYEEFVDQDVRVCPQNLMKELSRASFVSLADGTRRPVLTGSTKELLPDNNKNKAYVITPVALFTILLLLTCFITLCVWIWHWKRVARWFDAALLILQTLLGIVLIIIAFDSNVFGHSWNWYLIPFNPLPLLVWICFHKKKYFGRVYIIYSVVLVAFIALTPFLSQLDVPHQLLVASLAIRCISNFFDYKLLN